MPARTIAAVHPRLSNHFQGCRFYMNPSEYHNINPVHITVGTDPLYLLRGSKYLLTTYAT